MMEARYPTRVVRSLAAVVVVLAAVAAGSAAPARAAACTTVQARAAVASAKPHVPSLAGGTVPVAPASIDQVLCFDLTRDGRMDLAFTVASGGTAGDIAWVALVRTASGWRTAHAQGGYKIGLFRVGGDLVDSQPIYRKNDPNCCPTGGFEHRRWHWNGSRLVDARAWRTGSYRP